MPPPSPPCCASWRTSCSSTGRPHSFLGQAPCLPFSHLHSPLLLGCCFSSCSKGRHPSGRQAAKTEKSDLPPGALPGGSPARELDFSPPRHRLGCCQQPAGGMWGPSSSSFPILGACLSPAAWAVDGVARCQHVDGWAGAGGQGLWRWVFQAFLSFF